MASYKSGQASKREQCHAEGNYLLAIIGAEEKTSGAGNEMIECKCEVIGSQAEGVEIADGEGAIVYDYLVFSEETAWKIDDFRRALGETIVVDEEVEIRPEDIEGKSFEAHLIIETYKGKKKNKIGDYIDPNAEEVQASSVVDSDDEPF